MNRFLYALAPLIIFPVIFPDWHLTFFAPFIVLMFYKKSYVACLWISLFCGVIMDLLSAHTPIGIHAINYCMVSWILYGQKRNFFEDSLSTLPILTALFAACSIILQTALMSFMDNPILISWQWFKEDLIKISLWDAFYAFVWFTVPSLFLPRTAKRRESIFLHKLKEKQGK